jgi:SAM-dependent methyltransferase
MMILTLYNQFAAYYDNIFPPKEPIKSFLMKHLTSATNILDIGCATGSYAIHLAQSKHVKAIDLDKTMIQKAKLKDVNHLVDFNVQNMLDLEGSQTFDGIYLIGNTLVHLNTLQDISTMIQKIYEALTPEGVFILQIVNYDRVIMKNIDHLPPIDQGDIRFERFYEHQPPLIRFNTTLKTNTQTFSASTPLYPLTFEETLLILTNIGFHAISIYGDYEENPYELHESFHLILQAKK